MRQRTSQRLPDRATIIGEAETGETDDFGDPLVEETTVAENVPCAFDDATTLERTEAGDRVQRPATARFRPGAAVAEGRTVTFDVHDHGQAFEIRGIEPVRDKRRGTTVAVAVDLERA